MYFALQCCGETLKPGGSIFITTLNKTFPSWFGGIIAAEHVLKLLPTGTHDWNKFITPVEIQRLLETCRIIFAINNTILYRIYITDKHCFFYRWL